MERRDTERLEVRILGPVEARVDGRAMPLGGRRQQALLALLAVNANRVVAADWLADEIWGGEPPDGAGVTLRSYVSRLRAALGDAAPIEGGDRRYTLRADSDAIDAARFERLVREGDAALARRDARRAAELLREALAMWHGEPFGDVADGGALEIEARRLAELRLHAVERRLEAELGLGAAAELLDELEALVREHPFRERLWHDLMLALYRAGRQADALAAYHRARTALDEQLGIEPGEELQALEAAILRHEVPEPSAREARVQLPVPVSSFIGRDAEARDIVARLRDSRLVTLTGVGGVGKTRLALEAARRSDESFRDGMVFIDLSPLADGALVARQVAAAVGAREQGDADMADVLAAHLRDSELLLLLDNCEHLREPAALLAQRLLTTAPALRILATSREPLGVPGESEVPVAPMRVASGASTGADVQTGPTSKPVAGPVKPAAAPVSDAVRLFLERARAARPNVGEDEATVSNATRICSDLEGLPLAIELAAARAKSLSLEEIAERLDDRFQFLVSWRRLTTARHRTLREAMDWSYELLSPPERELLQGLSVFAGGFVLDAVASVCLEGDGERALQLVERLVDASLVIVEDERGETRYRLLETVRQYAESRLVAAGSDERLRRAHASWALSLVEAAAPELSGEHQARWFARLEAEHNNLRAALAFLAADGDWEAHLRIAIALTRFWYVRGYLLEGRTWLEQSLAEGRAADPLLRRRALTAAASIALLQGDYARSTAFAEESLVVARETGEARFVANALSNLGAIVHAAGDLGRAGPLLEEAVATARGAGDERIMALAINNLGDLALTRGQYERARPLFEESLALLRARGDTANVARALFNSGACALKLGDGEVAERHFREGLVLARDAGDREDMAWLLEGLAAIAAARGEGLRAAALLGAGSELLSSMGANYKPFERSLREETERRTAALLGEAPLRDAIDRGAALSLPETVEMALTHGA